MFPLALVWPCSPDTGHVAAAVLEWRGLTLPDTRSSRKDDLYEMWDSSKPFVMKLLDWDRVYYIGDRPLLVLLAQTPPLC